MRVASIRLQNFKRFTDLVVRDIPATAKLVAVVGPNGSGKSSLFDAFLSWYRGAAGFGHGGDMAYLRKDADQPFAWGQNVTVMLHDNGVTKKGCLYLRTAYRNDPDFSVGGLNRPDVPSETIRVERTIENDQTVAQNYQRLIYETMSGVYDASNDAKTVQALREELIGELRGSMKRVFDDLILNNITDPLGAGAFFFEKGAVKSYHYKNLSGGEKAAFDLLLDVHSKKRFYNDAIYCIDEVEAHLHTRVQGALVRELVNTLPEQSQLWVTTHSLGVLRAAQEMAAAEPGSVCIIDFDGVDPDVPRELAPSNLGRVSWEKLLSITIDDLSKRIAPRILVVCEGSSVGNRRKDFDAEIYNRILGAHHPDILFISGGASKQVEATGISIADALRQIIPTAKVVSLRDRDDLSAAEVEEVEKKGVIVLPLRNLESYLLGDEVIVALIEKEQKQELIADAVKLKDQAIKASIARGNQPDDLKSAAGEIYVGLKKLLSLQRCGNTTEAFMRDTLAPIVLPEMETFERLKVGIIDRL